MAVFVYSSCVLCVCGCDQVAQFERFEPMRDVFGLCSAKVETLEANRKQNIVSTIDPPVPQCFFYIFVCLYHHCWCILSFCKSYGLCLCASVSTPCCSLPLRCHLHMLWSATTRTYGRWACWIAQCDRMQYDVIDRLKKLSEETATIKVFTLHGSIFDAPVLVMPQPRHDSYKSPLLLTTDGWLRMATNAGYYICICMCVPARLRTRY